MNKKCGFAALAGRANTGKSTLLNALMGEKVSIVSQIPQTTRLQIRAVLNDKRGQVIFVDRPGFYISKDRIAKLLSSKASDIRDADVILYVVDLQKKIGREEGQIAQIVKNSGRPVILVLNKRDLGAGYANDYIEFWKDLPPRGEGNLKYYVPVSALSQRGVKELLDMIFEFLPEHPEFYPDNITVDLPQQFIISDVIREKIFMLVTEEVPHSVAVLVDEITNRSPRLTYIRAVVFVQREGQKAMIIGKKAENLKKIGKDARIELESLFKTKIYLDITVKVKENWPQDQTILRRLGIIER